METPFDSGYSKKELLQEQEPRTIHANTVPRFAVLLSTQLLAMIATKHTTKNKKDLKRAPSQETKYLEFFT